MEAISSGNSIENLYLIGNGFDIHHGIKCKYSDFHEWLCENNPMLENRLFQVYDLHHGDLWSSLETNLGEITAESILEGYVYSPMMLFINSVAGESIVLNMDDYTENIGEIGYTLERLYNDLQIEFTQWILQLENADSTQMVKVDKNKTTFISFNYTQTLEKTYGVPSSSILYIHGCAATNDNLIFGHNKTPDELLNGWENKYSEEELVVLLEAVDEMSILYKNVNCVIEQNTAFWQTLKSIKNIHVWGLSLSEVDMPYIKYISSIINHNDIQWEFSWYSESDKNRIAEIAVNAGISQYSLVKLGDLISFGHKQLRLFDD